LLERGVRRGTDRELTDIMIQAGTTTLGEITGARVVRSPA
jgi:hypothetical protein